MGTKNIWSILMKLSQPLRKTLIFVTFLLFPIVMNYMSPYVIIDGAFQGIISGSALVFIAMLVASLFIGRAFCGWVCPAAGLQECTAALINNRPAANGRWNMIKWIIWVPWLGIILLGFWTAGGIQTVNPLHLTETGISVDEPIRYVIYYAVLSLVFGMSLFIGRRAFCHYTCWMAPFMILGRRVRNILHLPALALKVARERCVQCGQCTSACSMSLPVATLVQTGSLRHNECVLCDQCVAACPNNVIQYNLSMKG